ncbi:MAG: hypothetical protein ACI9DK_003129 [Vicingaceae bacterium]|jgi:hypothetical protein
MNRIILIGNGFDKASGLETSYGDFILWYFKSIFEEKLKGEVTEGKHFYKDPLLSVKNFRVESISFFAKAIAELDDVLELKRLKSFYIQGFSDGNPEANHARINLSSEFFKNLLLNKTWGEIESEYFKALYRIKVKVYDRNNPYSFEHTRKEDIERLNKEFEFIRETFSKYIKEVDSQINLEEESEKKFKSNFITKCLDNPNDGLLDDCFYIKDKIVFEEKEELIEVDTMNRNLENVVFVNFNYTTNLIKQLFKFQGEKGFGFKLDEIRIHGNITEEDERGIIFGYGDDTAKEYREIEQDGNNEYLRFMKSTQYFHDDKYKRIISYINDDRFELFVAGHSLSLSDRVLLKTNVEHDNCRLIRFFHRGNYEDYRTLVGAMTRHFDDKIKMRSKFLPYDKGDTIS